MQAEHASAPAPATDVYVNYLPMPERHRRFLRFVIPISLWLACTAMFLWAYSQHDPGTATWEDGATQTFEGTIVLQPYPTLFLTDGPVLLVETGKRGPRDLSVWGGKACRVTGWPLRREGRRMLELEPGELAVTSAGNIPPLELAPPRSLGAVSLRGEIVDSKCFLGAMKPGEGKTHKECATLCIRGGIPPMLVCRDAHGTPTFYVVTNAEGRPLEPEAHAYIADLVDVRGELFDYSGLNVIRVAARDIVRAGADTHQASAASKP